MSKQVNKNPTRVPVHIFCDHFFGKKIAGRRLGKMSVGTGVKWVEGGDAG
jgi:hypothetical protein